MRPRKKIRRRVKKLIRRARETGTKLVFYKEWKRSYLMKIPLKGKA